MNERYNLTQPSPQKLAWRSLLAATYSIYQKQFWPLFGIGFPAALLTYLFTLLKRRLLLLAFQHGLLKPFGWYWIFLIVVTFVAGAVYWSLNTIFFAGIAGKLIDNDDDEPEAVSDAYSRVRKRIPALLMVALLTWTAFELARMVVGLALETLLDRVHFFPGSLLAPYVIFGLPVVVIAALVSRVALAVPELIDDPSISPLRAIRNSITKTENWEPFFIFFLIKTGIVGYGVYWVAQRGFDWLWAHTSISESAYYWVTWGVYVCLFAILESPLFIAFCVLYRESQPKPEAALTAPAIG